VDWKNLNPLLDVREKLISETVESGGAMYVTGPDCETNGLAPYIRSFGIIPLGRYGQSEWVIEFGTTNDVHCTEAFWKCLEQVGSLCAVALETAQYRDDIRDGRTALTAAYESTFESWSNAIILADSRPDGHLRRVAKLAEKVAREFGFTDEDRLQFRRGALLHTIDSYRDLKHRSHLRWLSRVRCLTPALKIARDHREHWDGSGEPQGLQGEAIPFGARLFAIVHMWDVLTHDRQNSSAWPDDQAREYLREQSGKIFDPTLVEQFIELHSENWKAT
jgi:response regulator RpfG family c-di-GMP phosphodiesterase